MGRTRSDGGSPIVNYTIYRGTSPGGETLFKIIGNVHTYTDTGLVNGQKYYYKASATNAIGEGRESNEVNGTPMGLPAPPISLAVVNNIGNITLAWLPPLDDGGSPITNYTVYRGENSAGVSFYVELGNVLNYTDTNVTTNIVYNYVVSASNLMGEGLWSNQVDARPIFPPSPSRIFDVVSGNKTVTLEWWPPFEDNGAPVTHYSVYRGTAPGGEVFLATAPYTGVVETFTDTGLTNGQTYYYYVTAWNLAGEGAVSNEVNATPASVPGAPTVLTAAASNTEVTLTWSPPADSGGLPITNYVIYRGTVSGGETLLAQIDNRLTYADSGLTNGVTYYYRVAGLNTVGQGPNSTEASATPATTPGAPQDLSAVTGDGRITLTWSAPADDGGLSISGYTVWRGTASGGEVYLETLTNVLTYVDTGLTNGQTYYYTVSARNDMGSGPNSTEVRATPATTPSEPLNLAAISGDGQVSLTWAAPSSDGGSSITNYTIYRGSTSGGEAMLTTLGNVLTYTDTGVTNGQTYYYMVTASNSVGEGPNSTEVSAEPIFSTGPPSGGKSILEEMWLWLAIVAVTIVLLAVAVFISRKKKGEKEAGEQPRQEEEDAGKIEKRE